MYYFMMILLLVAILVVIVMYRYNRPMKKNGRGGVSFS